jgi:cation-transporting ATPase I
VLAVASSPSPLRPENGTALRDEDIHDLHLLGFLGLADVPRPSAAPAVRELVSRGISVAVVTGDHPLTASAIAAEVGIPAPERIVTGPELAELGDEEHQRRVLGATVFARVSPEHKVRLVKALQQAGRTVAMTGDGTNDAAAIRAADVGIAIVDRGSAAAEKAADLLLTDADVARISDALTEGRHLWDAVRSAVSVLVGGNAGEVAFTLLGTALGGRAPLSPRQLLLVNLFTDMAPAMALAVRPRNGRASTRRDARSLLRAIAIRGVATASGATGAWAMGRVSGPRRRAETIGLVALVGTQLGQTLVAGGRDPVVTLTVLGSAGLLAAVVMTPGLGHLFGCVPLDPLGWVIAVDWAVLATVVAWLADRSS